MKKIYIEFLEKHNDDEKLFAGWCVTYDGKRADGLCHEEMMANVLNVAVNQPKEISNTGSFLSAISCRKGCLNRRQHIPSILLSSATLVIPIIQILITWVLNGPKKTCQKHGQL